MVLRLAGPGGQFVLGNVHLDPALSSGGAYRVLQQLRKMIPAPGQALACIGGDWNFPELDEFRQA
eukprot:8659705-Pyramimonas_sp.AAC.1